MEKVSSYARVDIGALAGVLKWLKTEGVHPTSRSALINEAVEALYHTLITKEVITPVEGREDAMNILTSAGIRWGEGSKGRDEIKADVLPKVRKEQKGVEDWEKEEMEREARKVMAEMMEDEEGVDVTPETGDNVAGMPKGSAIDVDDED